MHQDAHEFLNYLLNTIAEDVEKYQNRELGGSDRSHGSIHSSTSDTNTGKSNGTERIESNLIKPFLLSDSSRSTWVHQLFEGVFSNETKCLTCETV
jgi:ubiquitin C-terminal hydrolase